MKNADVTEADQEFWIAAYGAKVDAIRDTVGPFSASRCENSPYRRIAERRIEIRQALFIGAGEVKPLLESVFAKIDFQTPGFKYPSALQHPFPVGSTCRGNKADPVTCL